MPHLQVNEICHDIKKLDCAKTHLQASITSLKRLQMLITAVGQLEVIRFCSTRTAFFISYRTALYHTIPYCTVLHQNKLYQNGLIILHYGNVISYYILYSLSPYVFILYISIPLSLSPSLSPSLSVLSSFHMYLTHSQISLSLSLSVSFSHSVPYSLCPSSYRCSLRNISIGKQPTFWTLLSN
jgi:Vps53-like, N-terminal